MKKNLSLLSLFIFTLVSMHAQSLVASVEAESGVLTNVTVASDPSSSGGQYVTGFINSGDKVTVTVTVPNTSFYNLIIRYRSPYGDKPQDLYANSTFAGNIVFQKVAGFTELNAGTVSLNAGTNTISVQKNWGYIDVDKFSVYTVASNVFDITPTLIDAQATAEAKGLYGYLKSQFGVHIISGATADYYENVKQIVGKSPMLKAWDFSSYSPMYAYNWANGQHAFGAVDNHEAENAINWYNNTGKKGIVAIHWHWHSPSGGTPGVNTFYTNLSTFDVSKAIIAGSQENTDVIRDIDAIAVQLAKLRDAGVPVLWRPLHEAGGGWFWWGAKGSAPAKALWDIMYDRLHNYFGLHNLIWVWSSPEADWYPGNDKVDIIGYDSYPGIYNYTPQKNMFDQLYNITTGNKMIAMSENGPIPDVPVMFSSEATWSWFMTWNDLATVQNTNEHLLDVYNNPKVTTLENYTSTLPVLLTAFTARLTAKNIAIDWTTSMESNSDYFEVKRSSNRIDFLPMAFLKASRKNNLNNNYSVVDNNPLSGINYYQLIQYDIDGKAAIHGIRVVNFNNNSRVSVAIYPNPINGESVLFLNDYKGKKLTVKVLDISGKFVEKKEIKTVGTQVFYKLFSGVTPAAGHYIVHVEGDGGWVENIKIVIK